MIIYLSFHINAFLINNIPNHNHIKIYYFVFFNQDILLNKQQWLQKLSCHFTLIILFHLFANHLKIYFYNFNY